MTPTTKTFLKWLTFGIVLPIAIFIVLAAIVVVTHKDTPEQIQAKRDKFVEDSTSAATKNRN
jgi:hypothetical protein